MSRSTVYIVYYNIYMMMMITVDQRRISVYMTYYLYEQITLFLCTTQFTVHYYYTTTVYILYTEIQRYRDTERVVK